MKNNYRPRRDSTLTQARFPSNRYIKIDFNYQSWCYANLYTNKKKEREREREGERGEKWQQFTKHGNKTNEATV